MPTAASARWHRLKPGNTQLHYIVTDLTGTARELCSEEGEVHWRGDQQLWGQHRETRTPMALRRFIGDAANDETGCDLRYQGQLYDAESGLYYNRHRYYDPEIGQYISPDPIGLGGGLRPQGYVHNPVEWVDPFGLEKKGPTSQVQKNRANGKAWEQDVTKTAKDKYGAENVHEQVYIRPLDASGKPADYRVIVDNAIKTPEGSLKLVDAKASPTAGFTKNQKVGYPLIGQNGGIIESGAMKGTTLPPTNVQRVDPTTIHLL